MLLALAYMLIAVTLVVVVVDITAVYLQRDQLFSVADSAALNAANALDRQRFYREGAGGDGDRGGTGGGNGRDGGPGSEGVVPVSDETVRQSVREFLRDDVSVTSPRKVAIAAPTGTGDGRTAEVTLTGRAHLPLFSFAVARWAGGVPLRATVRARAAEEPG